MEIWLGIAKTRRYGSSGPGDGVETVERPAGGLTVILADWHGNRLQDSSAAKAAAEAGRLVAGGMRDTEIARALSVHFRDEAQVPLHAALTVVSADTVDGTLVVCRNADTPVLLRHEYGTDVYDEPSSLVGIQRNPKPQVIRRPLEDGMLVIACTDGVTHAGSRTGRPLDRGRLLRICETARPQDVQYLAAQILEEALALDAERAMDDMTVAVMGFDMRQAADRRQYCTIRHIV